MSGDSLEPDDRFAASDDTLADGDVGGAPPEARPWLMQQRFVHGMLRALHTADASWREARVQAVMAKLRPQPTAGRRAAAAAALLLAGAAVVYALWPDPTRMPRAEAMVAQAIAAFEKAVDRDFELLVEVERAGRRVERRLLITLRPGRRFLVEGEAATGNFSAGCDGEVVWFDPRIPLLRTAVPLSDARRLTERLGDVLDIGYLDLPTLLTRLPHDTELRCVGREPGGIRVEATGSVHLRHLELRSIQMVVDDRGGMLRSIDAIAASSGRSRAVEARLRYRHLGDRELGEAAYRRPW